MKPSGKRSLAATITSIFAACSLFSAFGAERVAFVIGNDAYPTVPLENAVRDATAFRDMLTRDLGFATEDVVFMTNSGRLAIFEQFETFKKKTAGARIVLVFYAGHGMESLSGKENFILPVDANVMQAVESEAALRASGINIMTLTKELGEVSDAAKIFLVDACRERPQGRGIARTGGGLVAYADEEIPADTLMILAAAPKGLASDGEKHGPFTAALLDILPKGGQDLMSAFFAVSDRVQEVTQKQQIPWLKFDGSGAIFRTNSFLKAGVPGVAPPAAEPKGSKMEFTQADLALPHRWIDAQGRATEAVFGGIQGSGFEAIVLLRTANGTTGPFPLSKLSPESREKARKLAVIVPLQNSEPSGETTGPIQAGSVWIGDGTNKILTITERRGETFQGTFLDGPKVIREVKGTIKDNKLAWYAKDVHAVQGGAGGDNFGTVNGDKIDFVWRSEKGANGTFTLKLK